MIDIDYVVSTVMYTQGVGTIPIRALLWTHHSIHRSATDASTIAHRPLDYGFSFLTHQIIEPRLLHGPLRSIVQTPKSIQQPYTDTVTVQLVDCHCGHMSSGTERVQNVKMQHHYILSITQYATCRSWGSALLTHDWRCGSLPRPKL